MPPTIVYSRVSTRQRLTILIYWLCRVVLSISAILLLQWMDYNVVLYYEGFLLVLKDTKRLVFHWICYFGCAEYAVLIYHKKEIKQFCRIDLKI